MVINSYLGEGKAVKAVQVGMAQLEIMVKMEGEVEMEKTATVLKVVPDQEVLEKMAVKAVKAAEAVWAVQVEMAAWVV
jgi:hypothetical protein